MWQYTGQRPTITLLSMGRLCGGGGPVQQLGEAVLSYCSDLALNSAAPALGHSVNRLCRLLQ